MNIAIVGCGNIAGPYTKSIKTFDTLNLVGFYDIDTSRASRFAQEHGGKAYQSLEELLADNAVDTIVNLSIFQVHYEISKQALEAGKHVYSEKPLTLEYAQAQELVALANAKNLHLVCAPVTFLGAPQQAAMRHVAEGTIGKPRLIYAEVNHGRIESWHPNPAPFYEVGPNLDVGVYPLTLTTALFGPVKHLQAFATTLSADRITKEGVAFTIKAPDYYVINLEFASGEIMRMTSNFYVSNKTKQAEGIEFHGDKGSLYLSSWFALNATLEYADFGQTYSLLRDKTSDEVIDWAIGLNDFAFALQENRAPRLQGEHAAHIVEILEATNTSVKTGERIELSSTFSRPAPMPQEA